MSQCADNTMPSQLMLIAQIDNKLLFLQQALRTGTRIAPLPNKHFVVSLEMVRVTQATILHIGDQIMSFGYCFLRFEH